MSAVGALTETVETCPVCGSPDAAPSLPDADLVQCLACDALYVSPRPTAVAIAAFYSAPGRYDRWSTQPGRAAMWRRRLDVIRSLAPEGGRLLDVGTGQGDFGTIAREHFTFDATEISSEGVQQARERHGLAVRHGDLLDLALTSGYYDAITLWHVLEHVANPSEMAAECHRLLKPGGVLAIAVPNADEDWQLKRRFWADALRFAREQRPAADCHVPVVDLAFQLLVGRKPHRRIAIARLDLARPDEEIHLTHFTHDTLARMLTRLGFHVVQRGIDDHSPDQGLAPRIRHRRQMMAYRLMGRAAANAIFVAARKSG